MNINKTDFYTLIHKAQRAHLFGLSIRIGKADFCNAHEADSIKNDIASMIAHLRGHSFNEATYIHPLYVEAGNQALMIDEEHDELEHELFKLEEIIAKNQWELLYAAFNRFIAAYLSHQDEEERSQEEILWKYFDDAKLSAALGAFFASRPPAIAMDDLKFVIPHLSVKELKIMYEGMKSSSPKQAFEAACRVAEASIEHESWMQLKPICN